MKIGKGFELIEDKLLEFEKQRQRQKNSKTVDDINDAVVCEVVMNELAGMGAGRLRRPYLIREYLAKKNLSMSAISKDIGVSAVLVGETIKGTRNNKRVLNHLKKIGCPSEFLGLAKKEN